MKKFIKRLSLFMLIIIVFVIVDILIQKVTLFTDDDMKLAKNINSLIIGHSHPAFAYNTRYINNSFNIAESGEAYVYTYFKVKRVIENNPQIKRVYIEFTNNNISYEMNDWIWDDANLQHNFVKYGVLLDLETLNLLYKKNSSGLINAVSKGLFNNILVIIETKGNKIQNGLMGGYLTTDQILVKKKKIDKNVSSNQINKKLNSFDSISTHNVYYLKKIVNYCERKKINVFLVRSPMHKKYNVAKKERLFKIILNNDFRNVRWIDNVNFQLPDSCFKDFEHLNSNGAKIYSQYFNNQINKSNDVENY